jgi:hypothetical protein
VVRNARVDFVFCIFFRRQEIVDRVQARNKQNARGCEALCKLFARGVSGQFSCPNQPSALTALLDSDGDADGCPGVLQVALLARSDLGAMHHRLVGELLEGSFGADAVFTAVGRIPDGEGTLEGVAVHRDGEQGERLVRDTAVDVHAAVIVPARVDPVHVVRLRVLPELLVVVGGAGRDHAAESHTLDVGHEQTGADEPVRLGRLDVVDVLVDQHTADVREALVQSAALTLIFQAGGVVRHPVEHLVADDRANDEPSEDDLVAVTVDHLPLVEERVVVQPVIVARADQVEALVVERIALADLQEELAHVAVERVGVVDERVIARVFRIAFVTRLRAGEAGAFHAVEDAAVALAGSEDSGAEGVGGDVDLTGDSQLLGLGHGREKRQVGRVETSPTV